MSIHTGLTKPGKRIRAAFASPYSSGLQPAVGIRILSRSLKLLLQLRPKLPQALTPTVSLPSHLILLWTWGTWMYLDHNWSGFQNINKKTGGKQCKKTERTSNLDAIQLLLQCNTPEILQRELFSPLICVPAFKGKKAAALGLPSLSLYLTVVH